MIEPVLEYQLHGGQRHRSVKIQQLITEKQLTAQHAG